MLRSLFEFACVLYIISSVSSVSFGNFCSSYLLCQSPLICSNTSQCICPTLLSFWNTKHNTCLFCPPGWIEWQNQRCLSFIEPPEGGISYQRAKNACLIHGAHLLQIDNHEDVIQLQYKTNDLLESQYARAVDEFLNNGAWINLNNSEFIKAHLNYIIQLKVDTDWCEIEFEKDISVWNDCVHVTKQFSRDRSNTSLCLSHIQCNEKLSYICERLAETNETDDEANTFGNIDRGFSGLIAPIINLAGSLFGSSQQPEPEIQQPQIQIISGPPGPHAQLPSASSSNLALYIVLAVILIVIIIVVLFCFCGGGLLFFHTSNKGSSAETTIRTRPRPSIYRQRNRPSTDSAASDFSNASK